MSTPTKAPGVRQFFSRHGALSTWHPNYEYRPGQLEMAEAVESALADRKHLIVEAGTGPNAPSRPSIASLPQGVRTRFAPPSQTVRSASHSRCK